MSGINSVFYLLYRLVATLAVSCFFSMNMIFTSSGFVLLGFFFDLSANSLPMLSNAILLQADSLPLLLDAILLQANSLLLLHFVAGGFIHTSERV